MKRFLSLAVCTALTALTCTAQAQSQDRRFIGPAIGVSLSATHNKVEYGAFLAGSESSKNDVVGRLDASYGFGLSPEWVLTVGAAYDLNKTDFGRVTYVSGGTQTVDVKLKDHFAVYLAPGYQVAPNWLVYGKLSVHHAKAEYTDSGATSGEITYSGTGFGLGVATALSKQVEGRFELEQINFNEKSANLSTGKPKTTQATIYLGYRF
jgi:opacity protein-like surface antigen